MQIAGPGEAERSAVEVAVGEHVGKAEGVEVVLRQEFEECLDAVVSGELVAGRLGVRPHLDPFDDERDLVRSSIAVEVYTIFVQFELFGNLKLLEIYVLK